MKIPLIFLLVFFISLCSLPAYSQNIQAKRELDSLKNELRQAKTDTAKIRLRFFIGTRALISRFSFWDSIIADAREYKMKWFEAKAFIRKGLIFSEQGSYQNSIKCNEEGYDIFYYYGTKKDLFSPIYNLSLCYQRKNNFKKALDYCFEGLKIAEECGDTKMIIKFSSMAGVCYHSIGEIQKAIKMNMTNLEISKKTNDVYGIADALAGLGTNYHALKRDDLASQYYLECKKYMNDFDLNMPIKISIYQSIGSGYAMRKEYDSAYKYIYLSYKMALSTQNKVFIRSMLVGLADVLLKRGDVESAKKRAEEALNMLNTEDFKLQNLELGLLLKRIYLQEKNYKKALEAYEFYVASKDSLTSETNRKQGLEKEFNYNLDKKESENKLLAQQNRIQALEIKQNKYTLTGMIVLVLLVLIIAYLFLRQNKFKNEQKSAELEQKLLRSQMNPHFIFNSLQAIQNFVLKEDKKQAENYLSSFASVMRNVLENSRIEAIPLNKEINLLKDYLQLQQLRFNNRFNYEINIDNAIDTEHIVIAPMLAQPFIENAIEHGFHDIETGGKIRINYYLQKNALVVEIIDNGVGMKDAYSHKQHRSLAIEITHERIALMNKKAKEKAFFSIADAFPEEDKRKGVKVVFILPVIS